VKVHFNFLISQNLPVHSINISNYVSGKHHTRRLDSYHTRRLSGPTDITRPIFTASRLSGTSMPSFKIYAPTALLVRHRMADREEWIEEIWGVGVLL
jgi:hypothetical protein